MDSTDEEIKKMTLEIDSNLSLFDIINQMDDYIPEVEHARKGY